MLKEFEVRYKDLSNPGKDNFRHFRAANEDIVKNYLKYYGYFDIHITEVPFYTDFKYFEAWIIGGLLNEYFCTIVKSSLI